MTFAAAIAIPAGGEVAVAGLSLGLAWLTSSVLKDPKKLEAAKANFATSVERAKYRLTTSQGGREVATETAEAYTKLFLPAFHLSSKIVSPSPSPPQTKDLKTGAPKGPDWKDILPMSLLINGWIWESLKNVGKPPMVYVDPPTSPKGTVPKVVSRNAPPSLPPIPDGKKVAVGSNEPLKPAAIPVEGRVEFYDDPLNEIAFLNPGKDNAKTIKLPGGVNIHVERLDSGAFQINRVETGDSKLFYLDPNGKKIIIGNDPVTLYPGMQIFVGNNHSLTLPTSIPSSALAEQDSMQRSIDLVIPKIKIDVYTKDRVGNLSATFTSHNKDKVTVTKLKTGQFMFVTEIDGRRVISRMYENIFEMTVVPVLTTTDSDQEKHKKLMQEVLQRDPFRGVDMYRLNQALEGR
jgi:hypothetical protein